jgi:signal peptidase II
MHARRLRPWAIAGAVVALDQSAKWLVRRAFLQEGDGVVLLPGLLDFRYIRNTGAAWGVLAGFQSFLIAFSLVMLVLLVWRRRSLLGELPLRGLLLGLLAGGIVGNLIDRIGLGYVVDFIHCHWGRAQFPAFNLADASICTGVGLYILLSARAERRARRERLRTDARTPANGRP